MERLGRPVLVDDRRWGLVSFRCKGKKRKACSPWLSYLYSISTTCYVFFDTERGGEGDVPGIMRRRICFLLRRMGGLLYMELNDELGGTAMN